MKIHGWEEKIKTHLDSCDGNQGIFSVFNSNYNRGLTKLIENIASKGIYAYKYSSSMMSVLTITDSYTQNHIKTLCNEAALAYSKFYKAEFEDALCKTKLEIVNALPIEYFSIDASKVASPWHYVDVMFDIKQPNTKRGMDNKSAKSLLTIDDSANSVKKKSLWDKITNNEESVNSDISAGLIESFSNRSLFERHNGGDLDVRKRLRESSVLVLTRMFLLKFNSVDIAPAVPNGSSKLHNRHQRTLSQDLESIQLYGNPASTPMESFGPTHSNSFDIGTSTLRKMDTVLKEHRKTLFQKPSPESSHSNSPTNASNNSARIGASFQLSNVNSNADTQSEPIRKPIWQRQTIAPSHSNSIKSFTSDSSSGNKMNVNNFFSPDTVKLKSPNQRPILSNAFSYGNPSQSTLHKRMSVLSSPCVSQDYTTTATTGNDLRSPLPEFARTSMISASRSQPRASMVGLNNSNDVYGFIPAVPKLLQVHSQRFQEIMEQRSNPKASSGKYPRSISLSGPAGRRGSVDK